MKKNLAIKAVFLTLVGNALPLIATVMNKHIGTLHIYGRAFIQSQYCPKCKQDAFILDGRYSCCGKQAVIEEEYRYKIEVDKVGSRRRLPSKQARDEMLLAQNNCCYYCGDEFGSYRRLCGQERLVKIHWDHFVPFSYDGNNHEFVAACAECNQHKHAKMFGDLEQAREYLLLKINEKKTATRKA